MPHPLLVSLTSGPKWFQHERHATAAILESVKAIKQIVWWQVCCYLVTGSPLHHGCFYTSKDDLPVLGRQGQA